MNVHNSELRCWSKRKRISERSPKPLKLASREPNFALASELPKCSGFAVQRRGQHNRSSSPLFSSHHSDPILAAVGQLQFEVVQFRMQNEYGVETQLDLLPYSVARWVEDGWEALEKVGRLFNTVVVKDGWNRPVLLFRNEWNLNQVLTDHPELKLNAIAPVAVPNIH